MKKRWIVKGVTLLVALSFVLASVCMALTSSKENTVTVSKEADSKASFTVVSTSQLQVKNNVVANITAGTKAYHVINSLKESCFITDKSGNPVPQNAIVATGYTLTNSMTLESVQLAVNGDINGDGRINGVDVIRAKKLLRSPEYSCSLEALDVNRDGEYTSADIDMIVSSVMDDPYKMADTAEPAPTLPIGEEFYARIMGTSSGKYLDLAEDNVVINTVKNTRSQVWRFKFNSDGTYTITNRSTGKTLDVHAAGTANGTNVQTYKSNNTDAQRWFVRKVDGYYVLEPKHAPSKALDVAANATADGTNVQIYNNNGSSSQKYTIMHVAGDTYTENTVWYATKNLTVEAGRACDLNKFNVQFANNGSITEGSKVSWSSSQLTVGYGNTIIPDKGTYKLTAKSGSSSITVTVQAVENQPVIHQLCPYSQMLGNSYVIKTKNNKLIVIDGGGVHFNDRGYLYEELQRISNKEVPEIEAWFLSHPHDDHVTEFTYLVNETSNKIVIKNVYFNLPSKTFMNSSESGKYSYIIDDIKAAYDKLYGAGAYDAAKGKTAFEGDVITIDGIKFEILMTVTDAENETNINDTTMVFSATIEGQKVLFLGDAYVNEGKRLLDKYGSSLKSDVVQMAHHGQAGVREDVYKAIRPSVCLWPSADWVYENWSGVLATFNDRTWMSNLGVKHHIIAGLHMTQSLYFPIDYSALPIIDPAP